MHEAGIAVSRLAPSKFWAFSHALFEQQGQVFDEPCADEAPSKTRIRLADLAAKSAGVDKYQFLDLVTTGKGNGGNAVTNDLASARQEPPRLTRRRSCRSSWADRTASTSRRLLCWTA